MCIARVPAHSDETAVTDELHASVSQGRLAPAFALRIADLIAGTCSVCGSDEDWGNYPFFFSTIAVVPMTFALAVGVVIGIIARLLRLWRSGPDRLEKT
jgi:hypothetical protein